MHYILTELTIVKMDSLHRIVSRNFPTNVGKNSMHIFVLALSKTNPINNFNSQCPLYSAAFKFGVDI